MTVKHGLSDKTVHQIRDVLTRFSEVEKVILFGSRAKGSYKPGSDIDLALVGANVDWRTIGRVDSALDDLPLPYSFSLIILGDKTDPDVAAHIHRVGIPLFESSAAAVR